ncbi:MAG TPA: hypothetical protein VGD45_17885 [Steroidobacter sp.]|uniref:hypothetical protein n=1 Tax=Steroidobacter sp. TaxID=1978227 RepID=UPI002EDB23AC
MKLFLTLLVTLSALLPQQIFAAEPLTASLEAHKVVAVTNGKEQLTSAAEAKPGDVIEYRATYKNVSKAPLHSVMATLPVPATGVELMLNSATPAGVEASIEGTQFAPVPLKRLVKMPDGTHQQQLVPATEYRFLRWPLGDLPAGASKTVSARVRVTNEPTLTTSQK